MEEKQYIPYEKPLELKILFKREGKIEYTKKFSLDLFENRNWIDKTFSLANPRLCWPNGMGKANLYKVSVQLWNGTKSWTRLILIME